jgi:hypothetical protein
MALPKTGDPCLYNDGVTTRAAQWLEFREDGFGGGEGTIRVFKISPDIDTAYGPDPDGVWSPNPPVVPFYLGDPLTLPPGQAGYTYEGYLYDLSQKTDVIFPLTGFIGPAWAPGGTAIEAGGPLQTLIITQKLVLGQISTRADQIRNAVVWQVADRIGSPMTLEVWNTTTATLLATVITDGSGINKDYQVNFATPVPGPQIGEFVYSAVAYSGAVGGVGLFQVYSCRLLEIRP